MDAGWLQKQGNSIRKGWRPRWFWADHEAHCLHYAEKQGVCLLFHEQFFKFYPSERPHELSIFFGGWSEALH